MIEYIIGDNEDLIFDNLIDELFSLNREILDRKIIKPEQLALALERLATIAREKINKVKAEIDTPPSLRIDP